MSCPSDRDLARLLEDAVGEPERDALEAHLDACAACAQLMAELALATPVRAAPDRYVLVRSLGAGSIGEVWEAEDTALARRVALKFIRADAATDPIVRARWQREARALAQIRHPNVVAVYALDPFGDELVLALELLVGRNARAWRRGEPRDREAILAVWHQVGTGLAVVHAAGIVHRDIKPENVVVTDDGRAAIVDFGLATGAIADDGSALTATGTILGTPLYMALEVLRGGAATARSDQFALCTCLWEAVTGELPYPVMRTATARAVAMQSRPPRPAAFEHHLYDALARGLDPDPAKRWPDVPSLLAALPRT